MDYLKQVISGSGFKRKDITIIKQGGPLTESGSVNRQDFGGAFVLLKASSTNPCRIRLYSDESSMILDAPRSSTNFNISESVALIADIVLDNTQTSLTFNPPILGNTFSGGNTFYNISGSQDYTAVTLTVYPIGNTGNSTTGRETLSVARSSISNVGYGVSGSITSPKSFLILSASASTSQSRLRLYSTPINFVPLSEVTRSFDTASQNESQLIADFIFDSASFQYKLVPILEAYTWDTQNYFSGNNQVGYILQNLSATATLNTTASLYIYSLED